MRILLIRTSALGDIVHCLPVLRALRKNLPEAHLGWLVEASMAPLIDGHPDLDEVLTVRLRAWRKRAASPATWGQAGRAVRRLRRFRADIALDLMGNHKAGILARLSGAKRIIGLCRDDRREPSSHLWVGETVKAIGPHAVEHALSMLQALDLPTEPVDFGPNALVANDADEALRALGNGAQPFALIHPATGWGSKTYPAERWSRIAQMLAERSGLNVRIALSHDPEERRVAHQIAEQAGALEQGTKVSVVECDDLRTLAAVSRRASIVLGGDTGPVHLAHALDTPVVCVMGPTDPERHGPFGNPEQALARRLSCSFCYRRFETTKACLLSILPQDVVERAIEVLDRQTASSPW